MDAQKLNAALLKILNELIDGPAADASFVLNPKDRGLLRSLEMLSGEQASLAPTSGGEPIAAHVDHLRYGLELMNRWAAGEQPFENADYSASWSRGTVSDAEWTARLQELRDHAFSWRKALSEPRVVSDVELAGMVASVVHLAYHFGAIRQIDRTIRGPSARD